MATHGESSSGSISTSVVSCKHNLVCAINTSGTERNPDRKFWCCRHWKDKSVQSEHTISALTSRRTEEHTITTTRLGASVFFGV
ncbi:hypothetical protein LINPERHAP1_LOCUS34871 [Linum perenne]